MYVTIDSDDLFWRPEVMEKKTGAEIDILLGRPEDPAIVIILRYFEDRSWPQWNSGYPDDHIFSSNITLSTSTLQHHGDPDPDDVQYMIECR